MKDIQEFYILGEPIETEIGLCHFLKVKDYPDYYYDLGFFSLTKDNLIYQYKKINKNHELDEFINEISKLSLFELALGLPDLSNSYIRIFTKVFDNEECLHLINKNNFNYLRSLVMKMNCLKEEKISKNPEIQAAIERSKRVKAQDSENIQFADIVTSVVGFNGLTYDNIKEFTIYQLYMTYYRIAQIKNYDTTTLFATVPSDKKINIESWSKHIDIFEEDKYFITREEFKEKTKVFK